MTGRRFEGRTDQILADLIHKVDQDIQSGAISPQDAWASLYGIIRKRLGINMVQARQPRTAMGRAAREVLGDDGT